jgi:hypothetical protein
MRLPPEFRDDVSTRKRFPWAATSQVVPAGAVNRDCGRPARKAASRLHVHGERLTVHAEKPKEEFPAAMRPARDSAALRGNARLRPATGKRLHVNFVPAGLRGFVCQPAVVGRDLAIQLGGVALVQADRSDSVDSNASQRPSGETSPFKSVGSPWCRRTARTPWIRMPASGRRERPRDSTRWRRLGAGGPLGLRGFECQPAAVGRDLAIQIGGDALVEADRFPAGNGDGPGVRLPVADGLYEDLGLAVGGPGIG